jgi:hypothetical protein
LILVGAPVTSQAQDKDTLEASSRSKSTAKSKAKSKANSKSKAEAKSKAKAKDKSEAKTEAQAKAVAAEHSKSPNAEAAKPPSPDEPKLVALDKLPKPIRALHKCAGVDASVEVSQERYAKSFVFLVTCPAERGALTPIAAYVARDAKGQGAKRVTFETLATDGTPAANDTVLSAVVAREAYTEPGDNQPFTRTRNDPPWFSGAWRPADRPGVCAVAANWRLQGDKAELYFWEEATECPAGTLPKYQTKLDRQPPPLVGK